VPWVREAVRPSWRGRLHQWAAPLAALFGIVLVARAEAGAARTGAAVFAVSLVVLFTTSATFHRVDWGPTAVRWMKRADHTAIFTLVAGTYTPFAVLLLDGWRRVAVLLGAWLAVALGATIAAFGVFEKKGWANLAYIAMGWCAVFMADRLIVGLSRPALLLVALGGVLYTVGAIGLALRRPNPAPLTFGYHEVWHALTIAAAACHGGAIWMLTA
jgi:hemolysin III